MYVAPRAGAWIEIGIVAGGISLTIVSLPVRERGLKSIVCCGAMFWMRRSPCGSVD